MTHLTLLANKYGSDKGDQHGSKHRFTQFYEKYFEPLKYKQLNILEVGVMQGASLKMWYDYFLQANIIGLDIFDKSEFNNDRISCYTLDQSNKQSLEEWVSSCNIKFDIIIDDGSHHISDQQLTFGYFFPLLNARGLYVIEYLHTSLAPSGTQLYSRELENKDDLSNTTLSFLRTRPFKSCYLDDLQNEYIEKHTDQVFIFDRDNFEVEPAFGCKSITSIITKK